MFVVDEVSFLDPAALHWADILLRWLVNQPTVPIVGVLVILAGLLVQKPLHAGTSCAELVVAADAPIRKAKSSHLRATERRAQISSVTLTRQMCAAGDPEFRGARSCALNGH